MTGVALGSCDTEQAGLRRHDSGGAQWPGHGVGEQPGTWSFLQVAFCSDFYRRQLEFFLSYAQSETALSWRGNTLSVLPSMAAAVLMAY